MCVYVSDIARAAVSIENPHFGSLRPRMEIAFNACIEELQWAQDYLPADPKLEKGHLQMIIDILESCRVCFLKQWPSREGAILFLEQIRDNHGFNLRFKVRDCSNVHHDIELNLFGKVKDIKSYLKDQYKAYDSDPFNPDAYTYSMLEICRSTILFAQFYLFKTHVDEHQLDCLKALYTTWLEDTIHRQEEKGSLLIDYHMRL